MSGMILPKWLKKGDTIGVVATSNGVGKELDKMRFFSAKKKIEELGYQVVFSEDVFSSDEKGRSSSGENRGRLWNQMIEDDTISVLVAAKGGDVLFEMLSYVDFDKIKEHPKWFQGYSDNTSLIHAITTNCDIATIYGNHFGDFGMKDWHVSVQNNWDILQGKWVKQQSFLEYEDGFSERVTGLEGYLTDKMVCWKNGFGEKKVEIEGRTVGGCLDVLLDIAGTKYDGTLNYIEKYSDSGILWYLESFDTSSEKLIMGLWKLKELGWFRNANGIVFGRPLFYKTYTNTSYQEAAESILKDLQIPLIFDADIGHKTPQFTMINGVRARIVSEEGKGSLTYLL